MVESLHHAISVYQSLAHLNARMRYQGKITQWNDDKGFGFITPNGGGKQVFVHIKAFMTQQKRPLGSEIVTYALVIDQQGRPQAQEVLFLGEKKPRRPPNHVHPKGSAGLLVTAIFFSCLTGLVLLEALPLEVLLFYLILSIATFAAYAWDKSAAQSAQWRTQEKILHILSLLGGWPGALLAQRYTRHKSRKQRFKIIFWLTVIMNCAVLAWWCADPDIALLHTMAGQS